MSDAFSMSERKCSSLRRNASSACARSIAVARTFATAWRKCVSWIVNSRGCAVCTPRIPKGRPLRSEEHTSELQSQFHLVCRLLLEKKKRKSTVHSCIYRHNYY